MKHRDNRCHYENKDPVIHYYSDFAIEEFIEKIMSIEGYLESARKSNLTQAKGKKR
jgi:hypothetical protein